MIDAVLDTQNATFATSADEVATAFRLARIGSSALDGFPGKIPETLDQAYVIQDQAIKNWPDVVRGWKVGRILGDLVDVHGTDRLIGPIFEAAIYRAQPNQSISFSSVTGGFCAVEGEYVFELGQDADPKRLDYDSESALALVADLWTGIEIAGSPLATINALGPTVVVSDFGNNLGLILGQPVLNWCTRLDDLECRVQIDSQTVGEGTVSSFPGGITQSLVFALNCAARRGMPLKQGMWISTGAVTGVHDISLNEYAEAQFQGVGTIACQRILPKLS